MYTCDICKRNIIFKKNLLRHLKTVHKFVLDKVKKNVGNFKCLMCDNRFVGRSSLIRHEKIKHKIILSAPLEHRKSMKCVIFEPSNLDNYPMLEKLIPEDYVYKVTEVEMLENDFFRAKFEIADCTEDMFLIWLSQLENKSDVTYRVKSFTRSSSRKILFNKVYRCIHNTFPRKYHNPHPKHTGCPATLNIRIKKCSEALSIQNTMANNNTLLIPLKAIVTLYHYHNHDLKNPQLVWSRKKIRKKKNETSQYNKTLKCYSRLSPVGNNEYDDSMLEFIDANIILYETDDNEDIDDNVENTAINSDYSGISDEFDNYIIVENVNTENSLDNDDNYIVPSSSKFVRL